MLTRKFLQALGIEGDKIDEIISAHQSTLEDVKTERDGYKAKLSEIDIDGITKQRDELQQKLDAIEKDGTEAERKAKEELETFKKQIDAEKELAGKRKAAIEELEKAGANPKFIDRMLKGSDLTTFDEKDPSKFVETFKDEWGDTFGTLKNDGADVGNPPPAKPGGVELEKLDMKEYIEARKKGEK